MRKVHLGEIKKNSQELDIMIQIGVVVVIIYIYIYDLFMFTVALRFNTEF